MQDRAKERDASLAKSGMNGRVEVSATDIADRADEEDERGE